MADSGMAEFTRKSNTGLNKTDDSDVAEFPRFADPNFSDLDRQILRHENADDSQSVLSRAVSELWRGDQDNSLQDLRDLSKQAHEAQRKGDKATLARLQRQIDGKIESDREILGSTSEWNQYGTGFLKTMGLFVGGKEFLSRSGVVGLASTVLLYGLDRASAKDDAAVFSAKMAVGGLEGGLMKTAFHGLGKLNVESQAAKGIILGSASRAINTGAEVVLDGKTAGVFDGAHKVLSATFDPKMLFTDAAMFTVAHGITRGANWVAGGAVDARPFYSTVATSASFGLSNGAYSEYTRQLREGGDLDYARIIKHAAIQGGLDMVAGVPGGLVADANFRGRPWQTLKQDGTTVKNNLGRLVDKIFDASDRLGTGIRQSVDGLIGPRSAPAFVFAGDGFLPASDASSGGNPVRPYMMAMSAMEPERLDTHSSGSSGRARSGPESSRGPAVDEPARTDAKDSTAPGKERTPDKSGADRATGATADTPEPSAKLETASAPRESAGETRTLTKEERVAAIFLEPFKTGSGNPVDRHVLQGYLAKHPEVMPHVIELYKSNYASPTYRAAVEGACEPKVMADMLLETCKATPGATVDRTVLYEYLAAHPEVDQHVAELYKQHFDDPNYRYAIEGFYKPPVSEANEALLHDATARPILHAMFQWLGNPNVGLNAQLMASGVRDFVRQGQERGVDITPAIDHIARTSNNRNLVRGFDLVLGSDYLSTLDQIGARRRHLPVDPQDVAQRLQTTSFVQRVAAGLEKLPTDAGVSESAGKDGMTTESGLQVSDETVAKASAARDKKVAQAVKKMADSDPSVSRAALRELSTQFDHATASEWFGGWFEKATKLLNPVSLIDTPAVHALGDDLLLDYFKQQWKTGPGLPRTPQEQLKSKVTLLLNVTTTFGSGQTARALVEAAKSAPLSVTDIATRAKANEAYGKWVTEKLSNGAPVESLTGEAAGNAARLATHFGEKHAAQLVALAEADPKFKLSDLLDKMDHKTDGPAYKQAVIAQLNSVSERFGDGQTPLTLKDAQPITAALNAENLGTEMRVRKVFGRDPAAADKLIELGRKDPDKQALKDLLNDPFQPQGQKPQRGKPREVSPAENDNRLLGYAYKDALAALAPQAETIGQLREVMNALKTCDAQLAEDKVAQYKLQPKDAKGDIDETAWQHTKTRMTAVADKNARLLDLLPRSDRPRGGDRPAQAETKPGEQHPRSVNADNPHETSEVQWRDVPVSEGSDADFRSIEKRMAADPFGLWDSYENVISRGELVRLPGDRRFVAFESLKDCESFARYCAGYIDRIYSQPRRSVNMVECNIDGRSLYLPVVTFDVASGNRVTGIYTLDPAGRVVSISRIPNGEITPAPSSTTTTPVTGPEVESRSAADPPLPQKDKAEPQRAEAPIPAPVLTPEQQIAQSRDLLKTGNDGQKREAVQQLSKHLNDPSAPEWFEEWRKVAADYHQKGQPLKMPEVEELPSDLVRRVLTEPQRERAPQPAAGGGGGMEPPLPPTGGDGGGGGGKPPAGGDGGGGGKPPKIPDLAERMKILGDAAKAFRTDPALLRRVLELGAADLGALKEVIFKANHPRFADLYKEMVKNQLDAGKTDLTEFTRSTSVDEARARYEFAPEDPAQKDIGAVLAEAGARGEVNLKVLLDHLYNEKFGGAFRESVTDAVMKGETDLAQFGRPTYINEQRVKALLAPEPGLLDDMGVECGEIIAEAAQTGELSGRALEILLDRLENPYCGRKYGQILKATMAKYADDGNPVQWAKDEYVFTAARAYRGLEHMPESAAKLVDLANEQRDVLKDILNGPRGDRVIERGYNEILGLMAVDATSIDQVAKVMKAVKAKDAEAARAAAAEIKLPTETEGQRLQKLIDGVVAQKPADVFPLLPKVERPGGDNRGRQGGDRGRGGDRGGNGNRGGNGGGGGDRGADRQLRGGLGGGNSSDGGSTIVPPDLSDPRVWEALNGGDDSGAGSGKRARKKQQRDRDKDRANRDDDDRWN